MNAIHRIVLGALSLLVLAFAPIGTAWSQQVKVTAADPASTYQGTVSLDVTVSGSGFDSTAQVQFQVSGTTNPGGITVRKVMVQGSKKLVATIDVEPEAVVGAFDIVVTLDDGRKGKGTTLFSVQSAQSNANDPCAAPNVDFPAFIYWQQSSTEQELFVADVDGKCRRSVMVLMNGEAASTSFSYPVAGTENVGRIAWPKSIGNGIWSIAWLDLIVNQTDRTILVGPVNSIPVGSNLSGIDLSRDGGTVYFSKGGSSPSTSGSVWKVTLDDPMAQPVLVRAAPLSDNGLSYNTVSINADESILMVEEIDSVASYGKYRLIRFCLTGDPCDERLVELTHQGFPSVSPDGEVTAYSDYQDGSNNCWLLTYVDAQGQRLYSGTQPRYGRRASWLGDMILANGSKPPDRRNRCAATDSIVKIDPATGSEVALVRGYDPDAR